jgi:hypothetical protein
MPSDTISTCLVRHLAMFVPYFAFKSVHLVHIFRLVIASIKENSFGV